jgi:ABC-type polysaccharide/polyol phosphate transport system ATPase subunit
MSQPLALRLDHVYKKFKRGEYHDSLRDLIPAIARRTLKRMAGPPELRTEEFWALQDVSFEVRQGETVGIVGNNGAGKSTMLKHLSGLIKPTLGSIEVHGRLSALIEVGAGFHLDLTGRENIFLNGSILGMSRSEIHRKFDEIVAFSELEDFIDTPVKRYSSGMFARLGFSVAAHLEPDILIIDEVLSVGDFAFQTKGLEKMRSIAKGGATVIFVSHNLRSVADLCSRALLFAKGRLVEDGPTSNVIRSYMMPQKAAGSVSNDGDVIVESVVVHGDSGPRYDFNSGDLAEIEVRIRARRPVARVATVLHIFDDNFYMAFNTSSERLGDPSPDLEAGATHTVRFQIRLHFAPGAFHVYVGLFRYDLDKFHEAMAHFGTLVINSKIDVRGIVNLEPIIMLRESLDSEAAKG